MQRRGVAAVPGLYFLGLQWMSRMASSFMSGVGDDAAVLADHIAARSGTVENSDFVNQFTRNLAPIRAPLGPGGEGIGG